ncbi:hypothetical protein ENUP19_0139G0021 [Entamoeba nuttalli]|uniref:Glucosidase II subunit alpha n=2 Tax=Entamoeba nuttalli TaxID=412467 RepID=K2GFP5_ENTNP|nr:glycosyl hydrolase, family 31 protein [Entamoeba nuttalli P19]EKE41521.1 glycosyl hydrolase, family 31 protein [Entamoeba nuttalli P19]|eukprot:XP_008856147.1 glycosyl hydrolase, family 31 protein [Entamoeba nuttalli P19]
MVNFIVILFLFICYSSSFHVYQEIEDSWYFQKANESKTIFSIDSFEINNQKEVSIKFHDDLTNKFIMKLYCFKQNTIRFKIKHISGPYHFKRYEYPFHSVLNKIPFNLLNNNTNYISLNCQSVSIQITNSSFQFNDIIIDSLLFKSIKYNNHTDNFNNHTDFLIHGLTSTGFSLHLKKYTKMYGYPRHTHFELFPSQKPYRLFNVDPFGYNLTSPNSLTGSIPFILMNSNGTWNGIHLNNPTEQFITVSSTGFRYITESGNIDVTLFLNDSPLSIVSQNMKLTGLQQLPPRWMFGYQQAAEWYFSNDTINEAISKFRKTKLPFDSLWLSPYANFNFQSFSMNIDISQQFIDNVNKKNIKLVFTALPFIRTFLLNETTSLLNGSFLINGTLNHCICNSVGWIDFTNKQGYEWYRFMSKISPVLTLWADYNEPSSYFSNEMTLFRNAQHKIYEHREIHNCYSNLHVQSLFEGVNQSNYYPFILTSGFYSGIQQYGGVILTQTSSNWDNLYSIVKESLSMSICGVSFIGSDVGGFYDTVNSTLYLRWLQIQTFFPLFRGNGEINGYRKEPFMFINNIRFIKFAFSLRYQFIDYWYSSFYHSRLSALPVIRPLFLNYPNDQTTYSIDTEWMINNDLLLCGVFNETQYLQVYIPKGIWYNYLIDERIDSNGQWFNMELDYEFIPFFVKGNTILLLKKSKTISTIHQLKQKYTINIYLDENYQASSNWYWSEGEQQHEPFYKMTMNFFNNSFNYHIHPFDEMGNPTTFNPNHHNYFKCSSIVIYGLSTFPKQILLKTENNILDVPFNHSLIKLVINPLHLVLDHSFNLLLKYN